MHEKRSISIYVVRSVTVLSEIEIVTSEKDTLLYGITNK